MAIETDNSKRSKLTEAERDAIRFITSWPTILFFGLGIPGVIGTGTVLDLESIYVRGSVTFWLYWLMVAAGAIAVCFAMACRYSLKLPDRQRATKAYAVVCTIAILFDLAFATACSVFNDW